MNDSNPSALGSLVNIFLEPRKTMQDIRGHVSWLWLPLLIVIAANIVFQVWYATRVDVSWFADQTLASSAANMTADQLRTAHDRFSQNSMIVFGVIGSLGFIVWYLIQALYFFFAAKVSGYQEQGFGSWLNFISWTSFPALLGILASALFMLTSSSRQISPVDIDITSLNTLLFHVPYAHSGQFIASSLRITTLWSWVLMTIGLSAWTGKSLGRAAFVVLLPYAVLYVIFVGYVLI
ncbi:MAG TPA: YIP1 family protein [Gammaproteobacteria bacterium]|jgi:hypothetical protein|nr:YIP1 family protein [Gammaproteobacteria bacterium]